MSDDVSTPSGATAFIEAFRSDPAHPARDPAHPRHAEALAQKRTAYVTLHPGEPLQPGGPALPDLDTNARGVRDPAARAQLDAIRGDAAHPYNNPGHPRYAEARTAVRGLYEAAYGTAPAEGTPGPDAPEPPTLPLPALPNDMHWDDAGVQTYAAEATELGVPQAEAATWLQYVRDHLTAPGPGPTIEEATAILRAEWGNALEQRIEAAKLAGQRLGPAAWETLSTTTLGNDPVVLRRLAEIGAPLLAARQEIDAIRQDRDHPFNNPGHRQHQQAREHLRSLYQRVYGTRPARA